MWAGQRMAYKKFSKTKISSPIHSHTEQNSILVCKNFIIRLKVKCWKHIKNIKGSSEVMYVVDKSYLLTDASTQKHSAFEF